MLLPKTLTALALAAFPFFYLREVVAGALRIAWDVFHPRPRLRPVLVRVPLPDLPDTKKLLLANLVTMTPGTLAVDLIHRDSVLLVHSLYDAHRPERLITHIQTRYLPIVTRLPV